MGKCEHVVSSEYGMAISGSAIAWIEAQCPWCRIAELESKLDKIRELIGSPESEQDAFGRGGPEAAVCASVAHEILAIIGPEPPK